MLTQLNQIHQHKLVYKYLTPLSIIVTGGYLALQETIRVQITDFAIVQLLDFPKPFNIENGISEVNRVFLAPELMS